MPVSRPRMRLDSRGGLPGQVVVEPDQYVQLGQGVVVHVDRPQRVRQRPGGVGDDERVPRVGLRATGIEVGDAAHGQAVARRAVAPGGVQTHGMVLALC
jgi:hypothetical protein